MLKEITGILGLSLTDVKGSESSSPFIELLIATRLSLRASNQYELADQIRDRLLELGVQIEDGANNTTT